MVPPSTIVAGTRMAIQLSFSNSSSFVAGKEECRAGACPPLGLGMGNVARSKTSRGEGLVPRWGRAGANPTYNQRNHSSHFHPLVRASQGHGDSGEGRNPGSEAPAAQFRYILGAHAGQNGRDLVDS